MWWENGFVTARRGKLYLGDRTAEEVARRHGTPLFVIDHDVIVSFSIGPHGIVSK